VEDIIKHMESVFGRNRNEFSEGQKRATIRKAAEELGGIMKALTHKVIELFYTQTRGGEWYTPEQDAVARLRK